MAEWAADEAALRESCMRGGGRQNSNATKQLLLPIAMTETRMHAEFYWLQPAIQ